MSTRTDRWFTLAEEATEVTTALAYRASLVAQRDRLQTISISVLSDEPWPEDVRPAAEALQLKVKPQRVRLFRKPRTEPGITVDADPRDDETFRHVVAIAPFSIGGTGISHDPRIIWSGTDTGTSFAAQLTPAEERAVRQAIADGGGDPAHLVPLDR